MNRLHKPKVANRQYHNIKVICCNRCGSEDIERVLIGNIEYPKCKRCGEVMSK